MPQFSGLKNFAFSSVNAQILIRSKFSLPVFDTKSYCISAVVCLNLVHYESISDYVLMKFMIRISETEFAGICAGIREDREIICKHNPIGSEEETLFWMLLSCLVSYLSLSEIETPCFTGMPDAETYRQAILFVLKDRKTADFDAQKYLNKLTEI